MELCILASKDITSKITAIFQKKYEAYHIHLKAQLELSCYSTDGQTEDEKYKKIGVLLLSVSLHCLLSH